MSSAILGSLAEMEISSNIITSDDPVIIISSVNLDVTDLEN